MPSPTDVKKDDDTVLADAVQWFVDVLQFHSGVANRRLLQSIVDAGSACIYKFLSAHPPTMRLVCVMPPSLSADDFDDAKTFCTVSAHDSQQHPHDAAPGARLGFAVEDERTPCEAGTVFCYFSRRDSPPLAPLHTREAVTAAVTAEFVSGTVLGEVDDRIRFLVGPAMRANPDDHAALQQAVSTLVDALNFSSTALSHLCCLTAPPRRINSDNPKHLAKLATRADVTGTLEQTVERWIADVDRIIARGRAITTSGENDEGPQQEQGRWNRHLLQVGSVLEQIGSKTNRSVIEILKIAGSAKTLLSQWEAVVNSLREAHLEAQDNIRYLQALQEHCEILFRESISVEEVREAVPSLLCRVMTVFAVASHYATSDRITSLMMKISNRILYIAEQSLKGLFDSPFHVEEPRRRIALVQNLCEVFRTSYHKEKALLAESGRGEDVSESAVFRKLDLLQNRLRGVDEILQVGSQFAQLKRCEIEGTADLCDKYSTLIEILKNRIGPLFDFSSATQYDHAVAEFNINLVQLSKELIVFINNTVTSADNAVKALAIAASLRRAFANNPNIIQLIAEKYQALFQKLLLELESIRTIYESQKASPPLERNMPPVSGAIAWSRQLLLRIELPMKLAQEQCAHTSTKEAKRAIRSYNQIASALVAFEQQWYSTWVVAVDKVRSGLCATLLVYDDASQRLLTNFDTRVLEQIEEVAWLRHFGLEIPPSAKNIVRMKLKLVFFVERLNELCAQHSSLAKLVVPELTELFFPAINQVNDVLAPGLTTLTWLSVQVPSFIEAASKQVAEARKKLQRTNIAFFERLKGALSHIKVLPWVCFVADWTHFHNTLPELLDAQWTHAKNVAMSINSLSCEVAASTQEIVLSVLDGYPPATVAKLGSTVEELYTAMEQRVLLAIIQNMQESLCAVRERLGSTPVTADRKANFAEPLLRIEVALRNNAIDLHPTLEQLQKAVNRCARMMLESTKWIFAWRQEGHALKSDTPIAQIQQAVLRGVQQEAAAAQAEHGGPNMLLEDDDSEVDEDEKYEMGPPRNDKLKDVYLRVGKNKDLTKAFLQLTGVVSCLGRQVDSFLKQFQAMDTLFVAPANSEAFSEFVKSEPKLEQFDVKLRLIDDCEKEIDVVPSLHSIGCFVLDLKPLKGALKANAAAWKNALGAELASIVRNDLERVMQTIEDLKLSLTRPLQELNDVTAVASAVAHVRLQSTDLDGKMQPILTVYDSLQRFGVRVAKDDIELVDAVQISRAQLARLCASAHEQLAKRANQFRVVLLQDIATFAENVGAFHRDYVANGPNTPGIAPQVATDRLRYFHQRHIELSRKLEQLRIGEELFGFRRREYPELESAGREIKLLSQLYDLYSEVLVSMQRLEDLNWFDADLQLIEMTAARYREAYEQLPKVLREFAAFHELRALLDSLKSTVPYLRRLREPSVRSRHWEALSRITKHTLDPLAGDLRIKHLFEVKLPTFSQELDDLLSSAVKEADIEQKINKIASDFTNRNIVLAPFRNRGLLLLKSDTTAQLLQDIEDAQTVLASLQNSRFNAVFKRDIVNWSAKLTTTQQRLEEWLEVQHAWVYMEAVFVASQDIAKELPTEVKRFVNIDRQWTKVMHTAEESPNIVKLCTNSDMLINVLPHLKTYLDMCQRSLAGYLHTKRSAFPRFFFLSDIELLDIMGHSTDPASIQPHLINLTSNVALITMDSMGRITSWSSTEGEVVKLHTSFQADTDVVSWLGRFLEAIRRTIHQSAIRMREDAKRVFESGEVHPNDLVNYVHTYPAQIALLGVQLVWTASCDATLQNLKGDKTMIATTLRQAKNILDSLVTLSSDTALQQLERAKLEAMITAQIHQLDIVVNISRTLKKMRGASDFEWQRNLRCNWRGEHDDIYISIADAEFRYGLEYVGCVERLVVTELTDRIYISCAQAMTMHYSSALTGPAGTGKTETTRDLGRACGRYFIVINCSEMMTGDATGRLVRGLAQSGCWCSFDELNRIDIGVLSVCASQLATVFNALRERKKTFTFVDGSVVDLDRDCGVFVTMNPSYVGRTELPENMKSMFRPIAVVVPDRQGIIRARLAASGFRDSLLLSKKLTVLYDLCGQQLSQQTHYDFGLRNVLSVLRTCGPALRESKGTETKVLLGCRAKHEPLKDGRERCYDFQSHCRRHFPRRACCGDS